MKAKNNEELGQSLQETLEEMAFVELTPAAAMPQNPERLREVAIETRGEWEGMLWLRVENSLLQETIENIYAIDRDEISPEIERDTLAELLNTLAGKVLRRLTSDGQGFSLGLPLEGEMTETEDEMAAVMLSEGRMIEVVWQKK